METIWTPLTLSLPDARSRTFPARAIFLAYQHGHVFPDDGRLLTEKALTFFIERFKSPLGGVLLGEVFLSPVYQTAYAYRGMLCEDEARLDTLEDFLSTHERDIETLIIRADKNTYHGTVVDVMERAKSRGIENIAIAISEDDYSGRL